MATKPALPSFSIVLPAVGLANESDTMETNAFKGEETLAADEEGAAQEDEDEEAKEKEEETKEKHVRDLVRLKRKRRAAKARVSGPAWEAGVKNAADWNTGVLRDRHLRGPWYWDTHSCSAQVRAHAIPLGGGLTLRGIVDDSRVYVRRSTGAGTSRAYPRLRSWRRWLTTSLRSRRTSNPQFCLTTSRGPRLHQLPRPRPLRR